ncbi:transglycosylase SLT domain-containing protein [Paraburkholderia mimosarum]|uniref:transglycosylase SLT domain-containing protein n=1 Tax=Paraburkholderia mimosarum TaxID=312026 RepID=UPI00042405B8|nr:lytic transglycosylase domain-containing protein [Paraburkholderia mimosarum]
MAAKTIDFTITAVDKATATINRVNRNIAKMTAPYQRLAKSAGQFAKASGLDKVAKDLGSVAKNAEKAATSVLKMGAPLLAIIGGGTVAGLTEMVTQWERIGAETERTSRLLGITAGQLTQMRGAANLMGVSSESMTQGFQQLQDTLQDARWGRNQAAFATLTALGVKLKQTREGTIDTRAVMGDLADVFQRISKRDPAAARNLARNLGVEQLLPILSQGRAALERYEAEAARLRGPFTPDIAARAQAFNYSILRIGLAIDGLKASISDKLAPVLGPIIDRMTEWFVANRDLISQNVAAMVQNVADAISEIVKDIDWPTFLKQVGDGIKGFIAFSREVGKAIDALGGFKTIATGLAVYMAGTFLASVLGSIGAITTAVTTLSTVAWANPIIAALAAIGFLAYEVVKHFREISDSVPKNVAPAFGEPEKRVGRFGKIGDWLGINGPTAPAPGADTAAPAAAATAAAAATPAAAAAAASAAASAAVAAATSVTAGAAAPQAAGAPVAAGAPAGGGINATVAEWAKKLDFAGLEKKSGLPAGSLAAVAQVESQGNAGAISRKGAMGLFQFMPATAREYGINPLDPSQAAAAAAKKLGGLFKRYHGNLAATYTAYNWGEGNLERRGYGAAPHETQMYAPKVLAAMGLGPQPMAAMPPLLGPAAPPTVVPAPVVNISNSFHVASNGQATIRTQTPSGLKIERSMQPEAA